MAHGPDKPPIPSEDIFCFCLTFFRIFCFSWFSSRHSITFRSSTATSRTYTTSPKLSSNSAATISSTVTNGDSSSNSSYTLNNSSTSGNRYVLTNFLDLLLNGTSFVCVFDSLFPLIAGWEATVHTALHIVTESLHHNLACVA